MFTHPTRKRMMRRLCSPNLLVLAALGCGGEPGSSSVSGTCEGCEIAVPTTEDALQVNLVPLEGGTGQIEYRLTNSGDRTLRILRRETALIDDADAFQVLNDDKRAGYTGSDVRWAAPQEGDFVELAPGATVSKTIDLPTLYEMSEPGTYAVRAVGLAGTTTIGEQVPAIDWVAPAAGGESAQIFVSVDAEHLSPAAVEGAVEEVEKASFPAGSGCTPSQENMVRVDESMARSYLDAIAAQADDILFSATANSTRQVTQRFAPVGTQWFYIFNTYHSINVNLTNTTYACRAATHVDCTGDRAGAFALTQKPVSLIRLCPLYFSQASANRPRILIHELSHQNRNSETGVGTFDGYAASDPQFPSYNNAFGYELYSHLCFSGSCYP